jgi:hypothetical protein
VAVTKLGMLPFHVLVHIGLIVGIAWRSPAAR